MLCLKLQNLRLPLSGFKRGISALLSGALILIFIYAIGLFPAYALDDLSVSASSAILIDSDSGQVIYSKNAREKRPQASTTKIMTAIIALEKTHPDTIVRVSPHVVGTEGSSVYLQGGEELSMEELVYALMLESANDAAEAIAYYVSGGIQEFAGLMNEKAEELGLNDTHFVNPHGLSHKDHYTTAYDLALLTSYALKDPLLCEIVSTQKKHITTEGDNPRLLFNHNKLLRTYDGAIGVKTGFTKDSGRCLVSAAEKKGLRLIAVTLNAPDDWNDHKRLLDYGFSMYSKKTLADQGDLRISLPVVGGAESCAVFTNASEVAVTLRNNETLKYVVELPRFLFGGFSKGDVFGKALWLRSDGTVAAETPLVACFDVERKIYKSFWMRLWDGIFSY